MRSWSPRTKHGNPKRPAQHLSSSESEDESSRSSSSDLLRRSTSKNISNEFPTAATSKITSRSSSSSSSSSGTRKTSKSTRSSSSSSSSCTKRGISTSRDRNNRSVTNTQTDDQNVPHTSVSLQQDSSKCIEKPGQAEKGKRLSKSQSSSSGGVSMQKRECASGTRGGSSEPNKPRQHQQSKPGTLSAQKKTSKASGVPSLIGPWLSVRRPSPRQHRRSTSPRQGKRFTEKRMPDKSLVPFGRGQLSRRDREFGHSNPSRQYGRKSPPRGEAQFGHQSPSRPLGPKSPPNLVGNRSPSGQFGHKFPPVEYEHRSSPRQLCQRSPPRYLGQWSPPRQARQFETMNPHMQLGGRDSLSHPVVHFEESISSKQGRPLLGSRSQGGLFGRSRSPLRDCQAQRSRSPEPIQGGRSPRRGAGQFEHSLSPHRGSCFRRSRSPWQGEQLGRRRPSFQDDEHLRQHRSSLQNEHFGQSWSSWQGEECGLSRSSWPGEEFEASRSSWHGEPFERSRAPRWGEEPFRARHSPIEGWQRRRSGSPEHSWQHGSVCHERLSGPSVQDALPRQSEDDTTWHRDGDQGQSWSLRQDRQHANGRQSWSPGRMLSLTRNRSPETSSRCQGPSRQGLPRKRSRSPGVIHCNKPIKPLLQVSPHHNGAPASKVPRRVNSQMQVRSALPKSNNANFKSQHSLSTTSASSSKPPVLQRSSSVITNKSSSLKVDRSASLTKKRSSKSDVSRYFVSVMLNQ